MLISLEDFLKLDKKLLVGKVIAFPTDTVFGIGCLPNDLKGLEKIYQLKARNLNKPLAILAFSKNDILPYVQIDSNKVLNLMDNYWPGALTIIFKKNDNFINNAYLPLPTIGFRVPNNQIALAVLEKYRLLATTSVNISGMPPLNSYQEINKSFNEIDYIIMENALSSKVSSTVVDATQDEFIILRQGTVKIV